MNITIQIDGELTDADKAILRAIAGDAPVAPGAMPSIGEAEPVVQDKPAPKKPGPKPKPKPAKEEAPEPEKDEKKDEETESSVVEQAVARAAELLQSGGVDQVKAALADLGATRVSQLKPAQAKEFLEKLA